MALTAAMINQAKPTDKRFSLKDENGLYLEVSPTGKKLWRVRYWYHGKENRIGLGAYPKVTLAEARKKCAELKDLIADDIDPVASKREVKRERQIAESSTFKKVAQGWIAKERLSWSEGHTETVIQRLEANIYPF